MTTKKIEYKDLNTWLKILVIYGSISFGYTVLWFIYGFVTG